MHTRLLTQAMRLWDMILVNHCLKTSGRQIRKNGS